MKRWVVAAALCLGVLLVAGVVVVASAQDEEPDASLTAVAADDDSSSGRDRGERGAMDERRGDGYGPPPWAGSRKADRLGKADEKADKPGKPGKVSKEWKQHWRDLSEHEREDLMTDLAREHASGMRRWAACIEAGEDRADRAACERPLPPGQAKKSQVP